MREKFKPIRNKDDFWTIGRELEAIWDSTLQCEQAFFEPIDGVSFETHFQALQMCILMNTLLQEAVDLVEARANQRAVFG